jgi:hypothetical protein
MQATRAGKKGLRTRCRNRFKATSIRNSKPASWLLRKVKQCKIQSGIKQDRSACLKAICEWLSKLLNLLNAAFDLIAKLREFFLSCVKHQDLLMRYIMRLHFLFADHDKIS